MTVPVTTVTPSGAQREPAPVDRIATSRAPLTGSVNEADRPEESGALRLTPWLGGLAGQNPGVVLPAICDTRGLRRLRAPAPCRRSGLVSQMSVRPCAGAPVPCGARLSAVGEARPHSRDRTMSAVVNVTDRDDEPVPVRGAVRTMTRGRRREACLCVSKSAFLTRVGTDRRE